MLLITCALIFVSSVQQLVVAPSRAIAEPSHANHMQVADQIGHAKKDAKDEAQESQNAPCCKLNCVTCAVIAAATMEITSRNGWRYLAAVFDDMDGHEVFDLMRPPRA